MTSCAPAGQNLVQIQYLQELDTVGTPHAHVFVRAAILDELGNLVITTDLVKNPSTIGKCRNAGSQVWCNAGVLFQKYVVDTDLLQNVGECKASDTSSDNDDSHVVLRQHVWPHT